MQYFSASVWDVNVRAAVDACYCTWGMCKLCERVCTESWLWEKNLLSHMELNPHQYFSVLHSTSWAVPSTLLVWLLLYSTILHSWTDWLCLPVILNEWLFFNNVFLNMHWSGVLTVLFCCYMAGATWNCWYSVYSVYTIQPCAMWWHFMQSHIRRVHTCLAVTRTVGRMTGIFCDATAVTRGWNEDRNKSQHRSWPWRQKKYHHFCWDLNPRPFNHKSGAVSTELSPKVLMVLS